MGWEAPFSLLQAREVGGKCACSGTLIPHTTKTGNLYERTTQLRQCFSRLNRLKIPAHSRFLFELREFCPKSDSFPDVRCPTFLVSRSKYDKYFCSQLFLSVEMLSCRSPHRETYGLKFVEHLFWTASQAIAQFSRS